MDNTNLRFSDAPTAAKYLITCTQTARRTLDIYTQQLAPLLYNQTELATAVSQLARRHRLCQVRLLVCNTQSLRGQQNGLIELAKRLPSKIILRQLTPQAPQNNAPPTGFCLADTRHIVFFNNEPTYEGFYRTNANAHAKHLLINFEQQWQHYSQEDPELKTLTL